MSKPPQVLPVGRYVVLEKAATAAQLQSREVLGPRCYTAGAGHTLQGITPDSDHSQVWFLEWENGLIAATCLPIGCAPDVQTLFDAACVAEHLPFALSTLKPANELAC